MASPNPLSSILRSCATLVEILCYRALHQPTRWAYSFLVDGEEEEQRLTYAELDARARAIAALLQQHCAPGSRALLLFPPDLEYVAAFFGCLYAGVIAVPAYPPDPMRLARTLPRLQGIVADSQPEVVLTTSAIQALTPALLEQAPDLAALRWLASDEPGLSANAWREYSPHPEELAFLQYTSGSTSTPKGVQVSHANLMHNEALIQRAFGTREDSTVLGWLPLYHDMGLIGKVLQPLYVGAPCILMSPMHFLQRPLRWLRALSRYRATISGGPNFAYELCVRRTSPEEREGLDLSPWAVAFNGSEPIRPDTLERFAETFAPHGFRRESLFPCYGLAEATLFVTGGPGGEAPALLPVESSSGQGPRLRVASGQPWEEQRLVIVEPETRTALPEGQEGEIWLRGRCVARGYWNRPEDTESTFQARLVDQDEGPFLRTGDLGFLRDGRLFVTGRKKDLIIIRGQNHYPQDIEATVERSHPALRPGCTAAFSVDVEGQEQLVVVQEVRTTEGLDLNALVEAIRLAVSREHELSVHALALLPPSSLPKTSSGKIQRRATRAAFLEGTIEALITWKADLSVSPPKAPSSPISVPAPSSLPSPERAGLQTWLLEQLAARLRVPAETVDPRIPFAHYGLDSKEAVALSGALEQRLGRRLPPTLLYEHPTVEQLAAYLTDGAPAPKAPVRTAPSASPATSEDEPIALIGMGCRLPGASDPQSFWRMLREGRDAIREVPQGRWDLEALYSPEPTPGRLYTRAGGFLDAVDQFDPEPFGISAREAQSLDPQQRLLLEVSWEALEDAGIAPDSLRESRTGVFVGISGSDYATLHLLSGSHSRGDPFAGTGAMSSTAAGRLSYVLGLQGPSLAVDTACSSSLVAVHLACQSLQRRESDLALAAGVNLLLLPDGSLYLSTLQVLSKDGRCKTFSASADGYGRGEGCGVVVLKRLSDALADGDPIAAVLRGSAINQDGQSNGLTAPNGRAQQAVIRAALERARRAPRDVGYVEAHGTGTALGDPIELTALAEAMKDERPSGSPLRVGSVKTNVGHLEAAAGITGLLKVVLALQHEELPPHLHCEKPSPHVPWKQLDLEVTHRSTPWPRGARRRLAGVSSFGLSGTNAHVVVEEAPVRTPIHGETWKRPLHLMRLSAKSDEALRAQAARLSAFLDSHPGVPVADVAFTANNGRAQLEHRAAFLAGSGEELRGALKRFVAGESSPHRLTGVVRQHQQPKVAFLFTGQGTQYPDMGRQLYETEATFRAALDRCDALLRAHLERPLLSVLYPAPGEATPLAEPTYAQPALFALEYALSETWRAWGIEPTVVVGHSLGEYAASVVAGVLTLEDALALTATRGRLMQELSPEGAMAMIMASEDQVATVVARHANEVSLAALNGPDCVVISGEPGAVESVLAELGPAIRHRKLEVPRAFHSPLMDAVLEPFLQVATKARYSAPRVPMISTLTGQLASAGELGSPAYWQRQLREPVRFATAVQNLLGMGLDAWLEVGPKPALLSLVRHGFAGGPGHLLASLSEGGEDWKHMLKSLGALHVQGARVDWRRLGEGQPRRRLPLPTYAFQRRRFWLTGSEEHRTPAPAPKAPEAPRPTIDTSTKKRDWIALRLQTLVAELLAVSPGEVDIRTPLVDLGADSIILIDGLQRIQHEFRVQLSLKDVFGKWPTIEALAAHLEESQVPEAAPSPGPVPVVAPAPRKQEANPESSHEWTPRQQAHVRALTDRYTQRTAGSKARRQDSQPVLADVRAAAGFRTTFPEAIKAHWRQTKELCYPIVAAKCQGSRIWDIDGNEYIDFAMGFGVHLFGHAVPWINEAIEDQLRRGACIGPQADHASEAARLLCELTGVERVTFCGSGTEAVMTALRLARGVVRRPKIALFSGSYHGSSDGVLEAIPMTLGAPPSLSQDVLLLEYGHPRSLEQIREHAHELSAVLVEPVQGRRPEFQPREFLQSLRALTREHGVALIFDEVLVGFRCHLQGAQAWFGVEADLVTYGKIIGGGLPIGVVAGKARFLDAIDGGFYRYGDGSVPSTEPVWFAGTFNKNPLAMAAAVTTLRHLKQQGHALQEQLNERTARLAERLNHFFRESGAPIEVVHFGSLFRFKVPRALELFFFHLLDRGIYVWEGRSFFLSTAHTDEDLERLVNAVQGAVEELREGGFLSEANKPRERHLEAVAAPSTGPQVLVRPRPDGRARQRLFCFPFAGGGTSTFRGWADALPQDTELCLVQLPGRDGRSDEPAERDFPVLLDRLERELRPSLDRPFAFFGHSMGALICFELARRLRRQGLEPRMLFLSGERAPHLPSPPQPVRPHELDDEALLTELARYGGLKLSAGESWVMKELLPLLRADLAVCDSYRYTTDEPLECPLSVFGGREDPLAARDELAAWEEQTQGAFSLRMLRGDHFFIRSARQPLLEQLARELRALTDSPTEEDRPQEAASASL